MHISLSRYGIKRIKVLFIITADEGIQAFCNGKVGIACISSAKIGTVTQAAQFDVKGAEFPGLMEKERRLPTGGNFLPITAQTEEEQKAAWEFIKVCHAA